MTMWNKTKMPGDFVAAFHRPFLEGPGTFDIATSYEEKEVRKEGNRFNAFRAALRRNPAHPTSQKMNRLMAKITYRSGEDGLWEALVTTRFKDNFTELLIEKLFTKDR